MLSSVCIDGLQAEVPYLSNLKRPSTPPRRLHHATFAMNQPPPPSCPPSPSGSSVSVTRSDSTSSDAGFPWTPNSDRSSGACHIAYSAVEAGSPTPSPSPEKRHGDTSRPFHPNSVAEERVFDGLLDNLNRDQGTSEVLDQEVIEAYSRHMTQLPASTFHGILRYLEAIRERQRMRYYTSCWDLAVVQRREAVALSTRDKTKSDFLAVERELQFVMAVLSQRLSLSCETIADSQNLAAVRDNDKMSVSRTDNVLATLKSHMNVMNIG